MRPLFSTITPLASAESRTIVIVSTRPRLHGLRSFASA